MLEYFAIRHKPSGLFLPQANTARSGTHTELMDNRPIRLFLGQTAAKNCLRHWLDGRKTARWVSGGEDEFDGGYTDGYEVEIRPDRRAEDMEIVTVVIEVKDAPA